jgi:serine/threonine protein kinase
MATEKTDARKSETKMKIEVRTKEVLAEGLKWIQKQQFDPCGSLAGAESFGTVFPARSKHSELVVGVKFDRSWTDASQTQENAILSLLSENPQDNIVLSIRHQFWQTPFWLSTQIFELAFSHLEHWQSRFTVDCSSAGLFARDSSTGLAHLHRLGVEHRSLKPANLMIYVLTGCRIQLRIGNFGSARLRPDLWTDSSRRERSPSVAPFLQVYTVCLFFSLYLFIFF